MQARKRTLYLVRYRTGRAIGYLAGILPVLGRGPYPPWGSSLSGQRIPTSEEPLMWAIKRE